MNLGKSSIRELLAALHCGDLEPNDIIDNFADNFAKTSDKLNAVVHWDSELAKQDLAELEKHCASQAALLPKIPILIKDNISVKNQVCSCASNILKDSYIANYDATAITNLRSQGALPFGRANMDEFAMGSSNETSAYGVARNPWDTNRIPGGSSGGSAAAVGGDLCCAALGSDTGGSIRQPAAFCGCVGFKPSYGRVSRYGLVAFASSLDQIGSLTKDVYDAALLLEAMAGNDPLDSTSADAPTPKFTKAVTENDLNKSERPLKVALPAELFSHDLDPRINAAIRKCADIFADKGFEIIETNLPNSDYALACYYIIASAEASTNLARFDGVRYGNRAQDITNVKELYTKTRQAGFGSEVKRRILMGTFALSAGYSDEFYKKASEVRRLITQDFHLAFTKADILLAPVTPQLPFKLGEKIQDPISMYLSDIFTLGVNLAGLPGMSLPCALLEDGGKKIPIGAQLIGKAFDEETLLSCARILEEELRLDLRSYDKDF